MDWVSVGWSAALGAASGGAAAIVAGALVRDRAQRRGAHAVVLALAFCAFYGLGRVLLVPAIEEWRTLREVDRILATDPVLSVLAARDPELRSRFQALLTDLTHRGVSQAEAEAEAFAFGQSLVGPVFQESLPNASGEALVAYATAMVGVLDELRGRNDAGCYAFVTGQAPEGDQPISQLIGADDQARMSSAMAAVLESAHAAPAEPVPSSQVAFRLSLLAERMRREHGDEMVAALASVGLPAPAVDPATMCAATVALYRTALAFPDGERETLLRCLFAPEPAI
jgi:hypothetical protein